MGACPQASSPPAASISEGSLSYTGHLPNSMTFLSTSLQKAPSALADTWTWHYPGARPCYSLRHQSPTLWPRPPVLSFFSSSPISVLVFLQTSDPLSSALLMPLWFSDSALRLHSQLHLLTRPSLTRSCPPGSVVLLPPVWGPSRCPHARPLPPGCRMLRGSAGGGFALGSWPPSALCLCPSPIC